MRWELGWRGRRWKLIIVAGVYSGWGVIEFHGIRVVMMVSARLGTGAGCGSSSESWVDI
jgi:hypothetical protein